MFLKDRDNCENVVTRKYSPHLGYIGNHELQVPNYLFSSEGVDAGYRHCRELVKFLLSRSIEEQFTRSAALTKFLRNREMTFSKMTKNGHKLFDVPCTTTPIPIPKSMFNSLERSAQVLVASLRLVLQDIYGSESVRSSIFVQSLPLEIRRSFINAVESCPHYFPQLHHPVMRDYPFFDVVGLDLVLTEDYPESGELRVDGLEDSPFRLLELNAGSPSGASNNFHIMEGLAQVDPEMLKSIGKVLPNDHFKVLGQTYRSLGETWTGRQDGVQIILPPGGENGAAPEIHQLAAYSGLVYADAGQLYRESNGFIRLRTVSGDDPVVTAIYSRVNSDSALFDPDRELILRDAETGKPLYWMDPIETTKSNRLKPLRNTSGEMIPLESNYAIPGAIEAIHARKLYLGGLNRILDNKIILAALCHYAPKFFRQELMDLGMQPDSVMPVSPPMTLPSTAKALDIIEENPEDWVIKTPNLSGGKGVYILKTMSRQDQQAIIARAKEDPKGYAYQKLVRIARIPVATKEKGAGYRYANLAADLRMWVFYGAGALNKLPRLTHNALIRTAPAEKGPLSSIVNTSQGGGYGAMMVVDDVGHPDAISIEEFARPQKTTDLRCDLPSFVGAQIVQVAQIVAALRTSLVTQSAEYSRVYALCLSLKKQCREILSFLHPKNMETVNEMLQILEPKVDKKRIAKFYATRNIAKVEATTVLASLEATLPKEFFAATDRIRALDDVLLNGYTAEDQSHDWEVLNSLRTNHFNMSLRQPKLRKLFRLLEEIVDNEFPAKMLGATTSQSLLLQLDLFAMLTREHLARGGKGESFSELFTRSASFEDLQFKILFADDDRRTQAQLEKPALIATEEELRTGKLLADTDFVPWELRKARSDWKAIQSEAFRHATQDNQSDYLKKARESHFLRHPILKEYRDLLSAETPSSIDSVLKLSEILPYARYNLLQCAKQQGLSVRELFESRLVDRRIAFLSKDERQAHGLSVAFFAGECVARKRRAHGLFSDSQIYLWIAEELHPLIQAYTVGHELVHFQQIKAMMDREAAALKNSPADFAQFLNFFGNFLGLTAGTLEMLSADVALDRKPVYGFAELLGFGHDENWIGEMRRALRRGPGAWNTALAEYGSILGYSTDALIPVKVKAIREVIPAFENAKNIRFAKDLGLELSQDEIRSALPTANSAQIGRYKQMLEQAIYSPQLDWETLRVIASHQYPGVRFAPRANPLENLTLRTSLQAIALGGSYNQTQQQ